MQIGFHCKAIVRTSVVRIEAMEEVMRQLLMTLAFGAAVLVSGVLIWGAQANTGTAGAALQATTPNMSMVEKAACRGWGPRCRPGWTWACGPRGFCRCVRC